MAGVLLPLLGVFTAGYALSFYYADAPALLVAFTVLVSVVAAVLPMTLRLGLGFERMAVVGAMFLIALQVFQVWVEGDRSWAHAWLIAAPLLGQNLGGLRAGLISGVLALLTLGAVVWARSVGWFPSEPMGGVGETDVFLELGSLLTVAFVLSVIPVQMERQARALAESANAALTSEARDHRLTQDRLQAAQGELVQSARNAGMAEVATGVLHNLGNALNTVAVTAQVLKEQATSDSVADRLRRLAQVVQERPDQLETIQRYLATLASRAEGNEHNVRVELDRLIDGIGHVASVVAAQQAHARSGGLVGEVVLSELIDQALVLTRPRLVRHGVTVAVDVPRITVVTEAHQVVQILVNLVNNAADALSAVDGPRRVDVAALVDGDRACLSVQDTGAGIANTDLPHIFQHGFTTKDDGNGFGLHSSALAAERLGGALTLDVPSGGGARFTLVMPLQARAKRRA